jgi:hypothetical protein
MVTILSVLIGGAITLLVAWIYHRKSSKALLAETSKLRKALDLMIRGMEQEGWISGVKRDADGTVVSWEQKIAVSSVVSEETFGNPSIKTPKSEE